MVGWVGSVWVGDELRVCVCHLNASNFISNIICTSFSSVVCSQANETEEHEQKHNTQETQDTTACTTHYKHIQRYSSDRTSLEYYSFKEITQILQSSTILNHFKTKIKGKPDCFRKQ